MFRLDVLQNQWLMLAMGGGLILILGFVLACMAFWKPRQAIVDEQATAAMPRREWLRSFMPWLLIVAYAFILVYAVVYTIMQILNPPNW